MREADPMTFRLSRHYPYLLAFMILVAAVLTLRSPARAGETPVAAKIANFAFAPPTLTIHPGGVVTWTNTDDDPHTVVADAGGFKSHAMDTGDTFTQAFAKPGVYSYHCSLHPYMVGKIVVQR
jgi:plastocyanin